MSNIDRFDLTQNTFSTLLLDAIQYIYGKYITIKVLKYSKKIKKLNISALDIEIFI